MKTFLQKIKQQIDSLTKTSFPSKEGQDASSCISLMDLHGSLFCLDNQKILFKTDGESKVLEPVAKFPPSDRNDLDAYEMDNGFAIKYGGHDYFYRAKMEVLKLFGHTYIKLHDISQPVKTAKVIPGTQIVVED